MTAPGNSTVLVVLLAAFVACSAYAAGRLHQRIRTGRDRDQAYRDGYDTATRSVFTLAARLIGPRRSSAIRGSAKVPAVSASASSGRRRSRPASYRDNARAIPRPSRPATLPQSDVDNRTMPDTRDEETTRLVPAPVSSGRHSAPDSSTDDVTTRLPPVPRPRSS